jgi:hypothetical protein
MKRTLLLAAGLVVGLGGVLLAPPHPASAHPLGNFSVNQLEALDLYPDRVEVTAEVDIAELPTLQERSTMDNDPGGRTACASLARDFEVSVAKHRLMWTVNGHAFEYVSGAAGLSISRLHCRLVAGAPLRLGTALGLVRQVDVLEPRLRVGRHDGCLERVVELALPADRLEDRGAPFLHLA